MRGDERYWIGRDWGLDRGDISLVTCCGCQSHRPATGTLQYGASVHVQLVQPQLSLALVATIAILCLLPGRGGHEQLPRPWPASQSPLWGLNTPGTLRS
jgi:hypothetical protein